MKEALSARSQPEIMKFLDLLEEYMDMKNQKERSAEETHRLAEVMLELNTRCAPKAS